MSHDGRMIKLEGLNREEQVDLLKSLGYVTGQNRTSEDNCVTHLYKGTFDDPGLPMCKHGWNRTEGYSIWRGNIGRKGICKTCSKRAGQGLDGVLRDEKEGES